MALTQKQMAFLDRYAVTGNARQSYIEVYKSSPATSNSNAYRVLAQPEAKEYLEYARANARNSRIADLEECLEKLTEIIREGNKTECLKAIDMRLKALGAYITKSEISIDTPTTIKVSIQEEEK